MANEPMYKGMKQIRTEYLYASPPGGLQGLPPPEPRSSRELVYFPSTDEETGTEG